MRNKSAISYAAKSTELICKILCFRLSKSIRHARTLLVLLNRAIFCIHHRLFRAPKIFPIRSIGKITNKMNSSQNQNCTVKSDIKSKFTHEKVLFIHKLWPSVPYTITNQHSDSYSINRLYTSLPAPVYIYAHCLFRLLLLSIISTAYHLLSGSRATSLLLN